MAREEKLHYPIHLVFEFTFSTFKDCLYRDVFYGNNILGRNKLDIVVRLENFQIETFSHFLVGNICMTNTYVCTVLYSCV